MSASIKDIVVGRKTFFITPDTSLIPEDYLEEYFSLGYECYFINNDKILSLDKKAFYPEKDVTRSDFNTALLKTLGHRTATIIEENPFSDVTSSRADYGDILLSSKFGKLFFSILVLFSIHF